MSGVSAAVSTIVNAGLVQCWNNARIATILVNGVQPLREA